LTTNEVGTSVTLHKGSNWLRAYGINSHPNQFGLVLVVMLLLLLPWLAVSQGYWRLLLSLALLAGLAGLLVSLSRSAWLAFAIGLLVYVVAWLKARRENGIRPYPPHFPWLLLVAIGLGLLLFARSYGDTVIERFFRLDTALESHSLFERQRDLQLALQLIAEHPWRGVQLGGYLDQARQLDPEAQMVHNVPLLISAEFGLPGLLIWLTLLSAPLSLVWQHGLQGHYVSATAVWLALCTIGLVQPEPTLFLVKGTTLWGLAASLWTTPMPVMIMRSDL
jgi:O-antigen ligase